MVKNYGTHWKVLSQGIIMWNIKALALTVQKLLARLYKSFREEDRMTEWQNYRMTEWQTGQKQYAPTIFDLGGIKIINVNCIINYEFYGAANQLPTKSQPNEPGQFS